MLSFLLVIHSLYVGLINEEQHHLMMLIFWQPFLKTRALSAFSMSDNPGKLSLSSKATLPQSTALNGRPQGVAPLLLVATTAS